MPLFGPAFLPFAHASSFLKTPGVPLSQSHIHPAKVSFCAARRLSFAAEAVLLGLCLSNSEIFHAANPFPLHREFFLLFCQNSFHPMREIVPGPSILSCADRIARPHVPSWSCLPGEGGLFRDPPDFLVPVGLPSCTYCHGRVCPARASPFREYILLSFTRQHSQSRPNQSRTSGEGCVHYTRSLPRIVRLWQPSMNAQASGGLCPSVYAVRSLYHRIFARQGGSHFQSMSSAVF